jgi:chemotaxis protein methyltransferase CheR
LNEDVEEVELDLLLEGVARRHGYDFRNYARASLRRRVRIALENEGLRRLSDLQGRILRDEACLRRFVSCLSVHVTAMFRDPEVYSAIRKKVVPILRTYPSVRVWHAGCSTGQEAYSLAIVLHEAGLSDRCTLYATDVSDENIERAKRGVYPLDAMREYIRNYHQAGGMADFTEYYAADHRNATIRSWLRDNIVFSQHSLVADRSFNEFNVILCRNVLIYFEHPLRARVHQLLYDSLARFGMLVLGRRETIDYTPYSAAYRRLDAQNRIYRRTQ